MKDFAKGSAIIPKYQQGPNKGKIIPPVAIAISARGPYFITKHRNQKSDNKQFHAGKKWAMDYYNVGDDHAVLKG